MEDVFSKEKIYFVSSCYGPAINRQMKLMQPGDICLLENVRFHKNEEINDSIIHKHFGKKEALLSSLNEIISEGDKILVKGSRGMRME